MIIRFVTGAMGAGKSAQLIKDVNHFAEDNIKIAVAKISLNKSESAFITSRNGSFTPCITLSVQQTEAEFLSSLSIYIKKISDSGDVFVDVDYIFIDEAQFLNIEQINAVENAALIHNVDIVFYGLMTDFTGKNFKASEWIMDIANDVHVIESECEIDGCERDAVFNARFVDGILTNKGEQLVAEKNMYKALCPMCYVSKLSK